ncbi:hypothetical protein A3I18_00135 [Candidatus Campbellbacteria bacterium RIFCSPLOWO2_02_FULL_35_11]|uniref:Carboxypeptidase regulatory-like domain-containing protein n=2 Tax=Candidatus Campbelliibacteriota TaxID=1752727 RepID=A0A1F5EKU0_9BACT|nr:MAG: hypothetical protein A3E89_01055 [Candidatus Campbellbacteria bacterium RIFCSPHIGHO2_12_FULL_35_10]OGD70048.1 MAG: hypothetical protein A3I18_00135 [Candidatus Campbellbacteria bacterium RIFCSPLOWO2_02_FULL_35_11]
MKNTKITWSISLIILLTILAFVFLNFYKDNRQTKPVEIPYNKDWKTFSNIEENFSFRYPETIGTQYIHLIDWPPQVQILDEEFSCTEGGSETARAGKTEKKEIAGRLYCVTKLAEGTAGSIYIQYAYAFSKNNPLSSETSTGQSKTIIFTFSLQFPQCLNYNEPNQTFCTNEQEKINVDEIIDQIITTFKFIENQNVQIQNKSGVKGVISTGPTCPVIKNPPEPQCDDKPVQGEFIVKSVSGEIEIKRFTTDANGNFLVYLEPDQYSIWSVKPLGIHNQSYLVEVTKDKISEYNISFDTGIR